MKEKNQINVCWDRRERKRIKKLMKIAFLVVTVCVITGLITKISMLPIVCMISAAVCLGMFISLGDSSFDLGFTFLKRK